MIWSQSPLDNGKYRTNRRKLNRHGWTILSASFKLGTLWGLRKDPSQAYPIILKWDGTICRFGLRKVRSMETAMTLALIYGATHSLLHTVRSSNISQASEFASEINEALLYYRESLKAEINRLCAESFQKGLEARK